MSSGGPRRRQSLAATTCGLHLLTAHRHKSEKTLNWINPFSTHEADKYKSLPIPSLHTYVSAQSLAAPAGGIAATRGHCPTKDHSVREGAARLLSNRACPGHMSTTQGNAILSLTPCEEIHSDRAKGSVHTWCSNAPPARLRDPSAARAS